MTQEDLETFGRVPQNWYFQSEREEIAFYDGDAIMAAILEANPESKPFLYSSVCDYMSRFELVADAVGMVPDLAGARDVVGFTTMDLAVILEIPLSVIVEWDCGRRPLPTAVAVSLCKAFRWPLAMLFRTRFSWHPKTKNATLDGDSECPF